MLRRVELTVWLFMTLLGNWADLSGHSDFHEVAALLKLFLSKLPDPLIPIDHGKEFLRVSSMHYV
jgi:hypothetical protein